MGTYEEWDSSADWYDQNMGEEGDALNRDIIRPVVLGMLGDLTNRTLLDCGCGSGYFTAELARRSAGTIGTDFSRSFIALCRRKYAGVSNLQFLEHDIGTPFPLASGTVDVVLAKMVLQYVPQLGTFARETWRVLKTAGFLLLVVDHPFHSQFSYAQQVVGIQNPKYPELGHYFDPSSRTKRSLWGRVELTWYPRTLSDYLQPFRTAGFVWGDIRELPEESGDARIPRILALKWEK